MHPGTIIVRRRIPNRGFLPRNSSLENAYAESEDTNTVTTVGRTLARSVLRNAPIIVIPRISEVVTYLYALPVTPSFGHHENPSEADSYSVFMLVTTMT